MYNPPILADREAPACADHDPELWFVGARQPDEQARAKDICATCFIGPSNPVCLRRALRDEQGQPANAVFGIFGGLLPEERLAMAWSAA